MRNVIYNVISHCASGCNMGKISVNYKISMENVKSIDGLWRNFDITFNVEDCLAVACIGDWCSKGTLTSVTQLHIRQRCG